MRVDQVAAVVAKVKLGDNREVNELVIREWSDTIGDLDFDDAIEGVRMHRKDSTAYLLPAHVRANVKLLVSRRDREQRIADQAARRALPAPVITLDREQFERDTQAAIEAERARRLQ